MESEKLSKIKDLEKNLKSHIKDNVVDLIFFGSFVKGKHRPEDLDVAIVVKDENDLELDTVSAIREILREEFQDPDTEVIEAQDIYSTDIGLSIILEGYSVDNSDFLREVLGVRPYNIYQYSLEKLTRSKKSSFNRSLRKLLDDIGGEKIGRGAVKVPRGESGRMEDVFKRWEIWSETEVTETFEI